MNRKKPRNTFTGKGALLAASLLLVCGATFSQEKPKEAPPAEPVANPRLAQVNRICIQNFGEDALGVQVREMVIARLFESKRLSLTENCQRADFILRGFVLEKGGYTQRAESESFSAGSASANEHLSSSDVKQQAAVTMRLVDKEGEILWAASLESTGGKTKGAIGDAAERAVRKFLRDLERAEKQNAAGPPKP